MIYNNCNDIYNIGTDKSRTMWDMANKTKKVKQDTTPKGVPTNTTMVTNKLQEVINESD